MKIALIADTHLAAIAPDFVANCEAAIAWINNSGVKLVIHLGDLTTDGIEAPGQIGEARSTLTKIDPPLLCVPGNHDIGDNPVPGVPSDHKPVDRDMLARFRATFGQDHWVHLTNGWTLLGLNAQLFGSELSEEHAQTAWLRETLRDCAGPIGVFLHKPWFRDSLGDTERHTRYVPLETRLILAELFDGHDLRFVASGHTHQLREYRVDGVDHYWVPSTAFVVPDAMQERIGTKLVGLAVLTLDSTGHHFDAVEVPGMECFDLADYVDVFPKVRAALENAKA